MEEKMKPMAQIKEDLLKTPYVLDYNAYYFDPIDDLEKERATWFYHAIHTPPGRPYNPMTDYHMMNYGERGSLVAYDKFQHPTCRMIRWRSLMGYFYTSPAPILDESEKQARMEKNKVLARPFFTDFVGKVWSKIEYNSLKNFEPFKNADYEKLSFPELIELTEKLEDAYRQMWEWHWFCSGGLGFPYYEWVRLSKEWLDMDDEAPEFLKLLSGFDNIALRCRRELVELAALAEDMGLKSVFEQSAPADVVPQLRENGQKAREWLTEFDEYLFEYGWQSPAHIDWSVPGWIDDPTTPIKIIRNALERGTSVQAQLDKVFAKEKQRKETEKEVLTRLPSEKRRHYAKIMRAGQMWHWWNEEHNLFMEQPFNAMGYHHYHNVADRLVKHGALAHPDDIFFLNPPEVKILLQDPWVYSFKQRVKRRRSMCEEATHFKPPMYLGNVDMQTALLWDELAEDIMELKMTRGRFIPPGEKEALKADLKGLPGSPGTCEGIARVVMSEDQIDEVREGEVLVAPTTTISWTPCFEKIVGVVVDSGGVLSHAAVIGREYGLPVVVMTMEGTQLIKTGQKIRVDGNNGAVYVIE